MGIVISVKLPECEQAAFQEAVESLLRSYGAQVNKLTSGDDHVLLRAYKETSCAEPVKDHYDAPPSPELPQTTATDQAPAELTVAISPSDAEAVATDPAPPPPPSGEVHIKDLSSVNAVPFFVDPSLSHSQLKVQGLTVHEDHVTFSCFEMSFKFPLAKSSVLEVANVNPQVDDTSIRVMLELVGTGADTLPVVLKLVEDTNCGVVFGTDMSETVGRIMEATANK